jgi:hypothetical protein
MASLLVSTQIPAHAVSGAAQLPAVPPEALVPAPPTPAPAPLPLPVVAPAVPPEALVPAPPTPAPVPLPVVVAPALDEALVALVPTPPVAPLLDEALALEALVPAPPVLLLDEAPEALVPAPRMPASGGARMGMTLTGSHWVAREERSTHERVSEDIILFMLVGGRHPPRRLTARMACVRPV